MSSGNNLRQPITVIKQDHEGRETWRYQGYLLDRSEHKVVLEAFFDREDASVQGFHLRPGDRFIETYYDDRWYNIYEIRSQRDDSLKGWYCNIGWPAEFRDRAISYRDLALDLVVFPDGNQLVLDEDEFISLPLSFEVRRKAIAALRELQARFTGSIG